MEKYIRVDNFCLLKKIGEGKVADVFLGSDTKCNELVAIKRIERNNLTEHGIKNIRRELEILHKMNHQNIVSLKNYRKSANHYYIILEYCNGGDLFGYSKYYIKKTGHPLNEFYIQNIIKQIAPAIEYMHSKNIIHRDIKLENILINFDNYPNLPINGNLPPELKFKDKSLNKLFTIKIADLGYSKNLIKNNENSTILGNPINMAPDIIDKSINKESNNKSYNTSTDLWSLGVITYELLTGCPPFMGKTKDEIYQNIKKGIYTLPKYLKCSIEIISFINGLLQYYPEKRLNWEQIKEHPFIKNHPKDFNYIDLEMLKGNEKDQIEINSKGTDNLLWIFFKCQKLNMNIDKINEKEVEKPEIKKKINQSIVINEEVKKASEEKEIEVKKEKQIFEEMKAKAEQELKKAQLKKINEQRVKEKLINDENEIKNIKNDLILKAESQGQNSIEDEKKLEIIELKLEKNKNDKEANDKELKNTDQAISENKSIIEFAEKAINRNNINEINKLNKEKDEMENNNKKLKESNKNQKDENKEKLEANSKKIDKIQKKIDLLKSFVIIEQKKDIDEWEEIDDWEDIEILEENENLNNDSDDDNYIDFEDFAYEGYRIEKNYFEKFFSK